MTTDELLGHIDAELAAYRAEMDTVATRATQTAAPLPSARAGSSRPADTPTPLGVSANPDYHRWLRRVRRLRAQRLVNNTQNWGNEL